MQRELSEVTVKSAVFIKVRVQWNFTSTETVRIIKDSHLDFHTAPELCYYSDFFNVAMPFRRSNVLYTCICTHSCCEASICYNDVPRPVVSGLIDFYGYVCNAWAGLTGRPKGYVCFGAREGLIGYGYVRMTNETAQCALEHTVQLRLSQRQGQSVTKG